MSKVFAPCIVALTLVMLLAPHVSADQETKEPNCFLPEKMKAKGFSCDSVGDFGFSNPRNGEANERRPVIRDSRETPSSAQGLQWVKVFSEINAITRRQMRSTDPIDDQEHLKELISSLDESNLGELIYLCQKGTIGPKDSSTEIFEGVINFAMYRLRVLNTPQSKTELDLIRERSQKEKNLKRGDGK